MARNVAGLAYVVAGVLLAAFSRRIGDYHIGWYERFWGRFGRWTSWLMYGERERWASRWWGPVVGAVLVVWGLQVLFGILNFL
jgi:hypothetical protein